MSIERKSVADKIETLIRQKRLSDDQLLHLMWIFAQEENVKISRSETCRLLLLERYNDDTIKKVMDFLSEIEKIPVAKNLQPAGSASSSTTTLVNNTITREREVEEMKKRKIVGELRQRVQDRPTNGRLPRATPEEDNRRADVGHGHHTFSEAHVLSGWLVQQLKYTKAAKKTKPTLVAPTGTATALPLAARIVPKKKKRKPRKKNISSKKRKDEEEEEQEEDYEEDDVQPNASGEAEPKDEENEDENENQDEDEEAEDDAPVGFEMEKGEDDEEECEGDGDVEDSEPEEDEEEEEAGDDEEEGNGDEDVGSKKKGGDMEFESSE
jgi:hypothetical protein